MDDYNNQYKHEIIQYEKALHAENHELCFYFLGRAHILSQRSAILHIKVHWLMLLYAFKRSDYKEALGQILRMIVTIPGHVLGKVPHGNIGWSTVKLTQPMPLPEDLKKYF